MAPELTPRTKLFTAELAENAERFARETYSKPRVALSVLCELCGGKFYDSPLQKALHEDAPHVAVGLFDPVGLAAKFAKAKALVEAYGRVFGVDLKVHKL
jgi:hypothetical protein